MSGTEISISHNSDQISQLLNQLLDRGADLSPAMMEASTYLEGELRHRFDTETAPDGTPWAPLTPGSQAMKDKGSPRANKVLHGETLHLRDEFHFEYDNSSASISVGQHASKYAAMHQFGGTTSPRSMIPNKEIVARPFFGFAEQDEEYIVGLLQDFLTGNG